MNLGPATMVFAYRDVLVRPWLWPVFAYVIYKALREARS